MSENQSQAIETVGVLAEPSRRALYEHVVTQDAPVSREQAAEAVGVPVHSAKFHLDRLVDEGLLEVEFRRLSGRSGPGAGRPSKLYRRAATEVSVTLPPRHYDLAASLLARAFEQSTREGTPLAQALATTAAQAGRGMAQGSAAPTTGSEVGAIANVLAQHGYEPRPSADGTELELANCPFDRLAREHTDLICGMNLSLVEGVVEGLGCSQVRAELAPSPEHCCVRARPRT